MSYALPRISLFYNIRRRLILNITREYSGLETQQKLFDLTGIKRTEDMKIKSYTFKNIKSFKEETSLDFGEINVFIEKNASGKSNIISFIKSLLQTRTHQQASIPPFDSNFIYDSQTVCLLFICILRELVSGEAHHTSQSCDLTKHLLNVPN